MNPCCQPLISYKSTCNTVLFQSPNIFYVIKKAFGIGSRVRISFDNFMVPVKELKQELKQELKHELDQELKQELKQ